METDGELLRRYAERRDDASFQEIVRRHGPMVLAACRRVVGEDGEDAAQTVFLVLARKCRDLQGRRDLGGWLHETARLVNREVLRDRERRRRREETSSARLGAIHCKDDPGADAMRKELAAHLDEAVAGLPAAYQEAVALCYLEGIDQAEAARRLGLPLWTVASRCARGYSARDSPGRAWFYRRRRYRQRCWRTRRRPRRPSRRVRSFRLYRPQRWEA